MSVHVFTGSIGGFEMTIEQIRNAINHMETNFNLAMDAQEYGLAGAFRDKIEFLQDELVRVICSEDPLTTPADVRFFEGF
jgi:hypothetical protein